jgi:hypothetical protein
LVISILALTKKVRIPSSGTPIHQNNERKEKKNNFIGIEPKAGLEPALIDYE